MSYTIDNNFRPGTIIVDFDGSKIYTDTVANKKAFNVAKPLTKQEQDQLDSIFNNKLRKVKKLLNDMGINHYALSKKKPKACTYTIDKGEEEVKHTFIFNIGGKLKQQDETSEGFTIENGEFGDGISMQIASNEADRISITVSYCD